jgi:hypothetical protein
MSWGCYILAELARREDEDEEVEKGAVTFVLWGGGWGVLAGWVV